MVDDGLAGVASRARLVGGVHEDIVALAQGADRPGHVSFFGDVASVEDDAAHIGIVEASVGVDSRTLHSPEADWKRKMAEGEVPGCRVAAANFRRGSQIVGMDQLEHVPTELIFGHVAEHALRRRVHIEDSSLLVEHSYEVARMREQCPERALAHRHLRRHRRRAPAAFLVSPVTEHTITSAQTLALIRANRLTGRRARRS